MVSKSRIIWLLCIILSGLVFAGCRGDSLDVPTPELDLEATQMGNVQRTEAAVTLAAAMSKSAMDLTLTASAPTATHTLAPSQTPTATITSTPFLGALVPTSGTLTPQITAPAISSGTPEMPDWSCNLIKTTPAYKDVLDRGEDFETHWILLNSGSNTWYGNGVHIQYRNGAPLHTGNGKLTLLNAVETGDLYEVTVPMKAPQEPGAYSSVWILTIKDKAFCWFSVDIEVE